MARTPTAKQLAALARGREIRRAQLAAKRVSRRVGAEVRAKTIAHRVGAEVAAARIARRVAEEVRSRHVTMRPMRRR
jgi:hypothetical protein